MKNNRDIKMLKVIEMLREGKNDTKDISEKLGISMGYVGSEIYRLKKLGVKVKKVFIIENE